MVDSASFKRTFNSPDLKAVCLCTRLIPLSAPLLAVYLSLYSSKLTSCPSLPPSTPRSPPHPHTSLLIPSPSPPKSCPVSPFLKSCHTSLRFCFDTGVSTLMHLQVPHLFPTPAHRHLMSACLCVFHTHSLYMAHPH